jgi:hypothetical protein
MELGEDSHVVHYLPRLPELLASHPAERALQAAAGGWARAGQIRCDRCRRDPGGLLPCAPLRQDVTWDHVDVDGDPHASLSSPPWIVVWRSVRAGGDTEARRSRRTLALPARTVEALRFPRQPLSASLR